MSFKLALLFLFAFVALAVAVPFDTEEKSEAAEPVAADAKKPDVSLRNPRLVSIQETLSSLCNIYILIYVTLEMFQMKGRNTI